MIQSSVDRRDEGPTAPTNPAGEGPVRMPGIPLPPELVLRLLRGISLGGVIEIVLAGGDPSQRGKETSRSSREEEFDRARERYSGLIGELSKFPLVKENLPELFKFEKKIARMPCPTLPTDPLESAAVLKQLSAFDQTSVTGIFHELLDQLEKGSCYLREFQELGILGDLKAGFRDESRGVRLFYSGDKQIELGGRDKGVSAFYNPLKNEATIEGHPPTMAELLSRMAEDGALPQQIEHIHHELTHSLQRGAGISRRLKGALSVGATIAVGVAVVPLQSFALQLAAQIGSFLGISWGIDRISAPYEQNLSTTSRALRELQAYMATEESPSSSRPPRSPMEHINHIALQIGSEVSWYEKDERIPDDALVISPERMVIAAAAVSGGGAQLSALRLLGISHERLGRILRTTHYDPRIGGFPELIAAEAAERCRLGLSDTAAYTKLLNALKLKRSVENEQARALACKLARNALVQLGVSKADPENSAIH